MIKAARQEEILHILNQYKHLSVQEIAKEIFASPATVRRDLHVLESQGLVRRSYGGVSLLKYKNQELPLSIRETESRQRKKLIAGIAARIIEPKETVLLDASSTAMQLAECIDVSKDVTVVTNGVKTAMLLGNRGIRTYCVGGLFNVRSMLFTGTFAEKNLASIHADVLFFSSQGLDMSGNISDYSEVETHLRQLMLQRARKRYFLCDSSKIGKSFLFSVGNIAELNGVICDIPLSEDLKKLLPEGNGQA